MKNLIIRGITGSIFVAVVFAAVVLYQQYSVIFFVLFLFFALVGVLELLKISHQLSASPQVVLPLFLAASFFSAVQLYADSSYLSTILFLITLVVAVLTFVVELFRNRKTPLLNIAVVMLSIIWIVVPFSLLGWMLQSGAHAIVLALFVIIWLNDTLAFCAGSLFGKHKLCERISPKKSWEGFITALILTVLSSIFFAYIPYFENTEINTPIQWTGFALVVVLFGTTGDLVESMFKRNCKVKDSGHILPGHGGVLDRFDSSLIAIPMAFVYWLICAL
ncbi:MAG TPA: phosphatidate cytidylyltransferase [Bacteroidales bacterium]|nr:phosphatidate cytidylyltransferase [Bacteroidales bacterium]HPT51796.1 phosphatidate cytidylyltransferase [Bacteroidales bacterium]